MPKIKILSNNATQQHNVITKARAWGAAARDSDYGPVAGKTAVVINTLLGGGKTKPALQISSLGFAPKKKPYTHTFSYSEFMNLDTCPWDASRQASQADTAQAVRDIPQAAQAPRIKTVIQKEVVVVVEETEVGVCTQDTLRVKSLDVITQEAVGFVTLGLPFLVDAGVDVTELDGKTYLINPKKNTAKVVTAKSVAKRARKDILAGKTESPFAIYAKTFDLLDNVVMEKVVPEDD